MMKTLITTLLMSVVGFACAGTPTLPDATPPASVPQQSILQMRNYLDVVDGKIFIQADDFPGEVKLNDVVGKERDLLLVSKDGDAIPISVKTSGQIHLKTQKEFEAKFHDCNGYPHDAFVVEIEKATTLQTRGRLTGLAFAAGSRFITITSNEAADGFKKVSAMHLKYVQAMYGNQFPKYGDIIATQTVAVRMANGKIFFWTPNPAMDERKDQGYVWDEASGTALPVKLYPRVSCTT